MTLQLQSSDFGKFFNELYGCDPFPWQQRLAQHVHETGWPAFIDLPTASGKTACLDVAVFALALQATRNPKERTTGRRIFFVVNRRVIVDEAYERAVELAKRMSEATQGSVLHAVATALQEISGDRDAPPLDVALLRGGIFKDNRWARSITQPTIITSTVDQVGSRLLFRGYGVSDAARPLHAALIAHDSLILLDEAHISRPFVQTLNAVKRYRGSAWAETPVQTPFHFVQMTATHGEMEEQPFTLNHEDYSCEALRMRLEKAKPVALRVAENADKGNSKSDKKDQAAYEAFADELVKQALGLVNGQRRNIAIVVNRIITARLVKQYLEKALGDKGNQEGEVYLAMGAMRPIDRDALTKKIQARVGKKPDQCPGGGPMFVVATQCLEVGADFDFDAMVSECASLDTLRQRFGRLNRRGREVDACGVIVIRKDQENEEDDPIYGKALRNTWEWLKRISKGGTIDFSVSGLKGILGETDITEMLAPSEHAPILFPAYLDAWAQTNPIPAPDPEVSLFIHGPDRSIPDVQVCWRNDLDEIDMNDWLQAVELCPPTSPECMTVPIGTVRKWLAGMDKEDTLASDMLEAKVPSDRIEEKVFQRRGVIWRGPDNSEVVTEASDLRPGDTLVVPVSAQCWNLFGHIPDDADKDVSETAYRLSQGRVLVRLSPKRLQHLNDKAAVSALQKWVQNEDSDLRISEIRSLLREAANDIAPMKQDLADALRLLGDEEYGLVYERYPDKQIVVLRTRKRIPRESLIPTMDEGEDSSSRTEQLRYIPLADHLRHVAHTLDKALERLPVLEYARALHAAAEKHDWGKADERFQAMLINGTLEDAWAQPTVWGKSAFMPETPALRHAARLRSGLPEGWRHEMLSMKLAEVALADSDLNPLETCLTLHLIAAHHGHGRPFASVVFDDNPPDIQLELPGIKMVYTTEQRKESPAHRLDSGVAERFWALTRRFGWWGLAYLEAVVRLADQRASQMESEGYLLPDFNQTNNRDPING